MKDEIKKIRDYIACPQLGDDYYGEWGALRLDQRLKIKSLLDYITNLQEENERLKGEYHTFEAPSKLVEAINMGTIYKSRIEKAIEYIKEDIYVEPNELYGLVDGEHLLNILQGVGKDE